MKKLLIFVTVLMLIVGTSLMVSAVTDDTSDATVNADFLAEFGAVTGPEVTLTTTALDGANIAMDTAASVPLSANANWELSVAVASGTTFSNTASTDAASGVNSQMF